MAKRRVLVTGGTGFLGRPLVVELQRGGWAVSVSARRPTDSGGIAFFEMDLERDSDWSVALRGVDSVVHAAARAHVLRETAKDPLSLFRAINRDATFRLARQAAEAGVRRFVFVSSIGVNGAETKGRPFRADDPPAPHSPYAVAKHEAELGLQEIARETAMEIVIVRPPLMMGPGAKGNLGALARAIAKGLPLPFALVTRNRRDLVSLETMVDLIITCIDHPAAAAEIFLVSDGAPLSTKQLLERLATYAGRKARLIPVPPKLVETLLKLAGRRSMASQLLGDLEVDIGHTVRTLGWSPREPE